MTEEAQIIGGKYRVVRRIGVGGMGEVLLAMHEQLDQQVAIKVLKHELTKQPIAVERFLREARAAARIQNDHVVRVFDVATLEDGTPYIVMEYLEGEDLSQTLSRGALPVQDVIDYVLQACVAIAEAHRVGVIHRDLKPANLFLVRRRDGKALIKVVDFGISKVTPTGMRVEAALTTTSRLMGSPFYMSPEQLRGEDIDGRSDIWSLGLILFELLTDDGPFEAPTVPQLCAQIMEAEPKRASALRPDLPSRLDDVIHRCLAKKADDRFSDVGALAAALAPLASEDTRGAATAARAALVRPPTPPVAIPVAARPVRAPEAEEGARITSNTWNTGNVALAKRRRTPLVLGGVGIAVTLVIAAIVTMRMVSHESNAGATSAPSEAVALPPPSPEVPISPAPSPSSSVAADAPSATPSSSAGTRLPAAATAKPKPTVSKPKGGASDEFGGRK